MAVSRKDTWMLQWRTLWPGVTWPYSKHMWGRFCTKWPCMPCEVAWDWVCSLLLGTFCVTACFKCPHLTLVYTYVLLFSCLTKHLTFLMSQLETKSSNMLSMQSTPERHQNLSDTALSFFFISLFNAYGSFTCMYICVPHVCGACRGREMGCWISWNWIYGWLLAAM